MLHWNCKALLTIALACAAFCAHGQSLQLPRQDSFGQPIDVGLLVLGHSTSGVGDWPGKLERSLNADAVNSRNYLVFRTIVGGDGGFLWSRLSVPPGDLQYDRVRTFGENMQWCQDTVSRVRYSARRAKLEWSLRGSNPVPSTCATTWAAPPTIACVWHENGTRFTQSMEFHACWRKMDVRLALIQDTTNRSWPIDDYTGDGVVDTRDFFKADVVAPQAWTCPAGSANASGVVTSDGTKWIDWNCDNRLDTADAAHLQYSLWLERLSLDLLTRFGASNAHHVFITQKPVEMVTAPACSRWFAGETGLCTNFDFHRVRAATPSRPFTFAYLPTVFWERRAIEAMDARSTLDARIHLATPDDVRTMWGRSAGCYETGVDASDWSIPTTVGRPTAVTADIGEDDSDVTTPRSADVEGCMNFDHIHHNEAGGWLMADVWYAGLIPYLDGP